MARYILKNKNNEYLGYDKNKALIKINKIEEAAIFKDRARAANFSKMLPKNLRDEWFPEDLSKLPAKKVELSETYKKIETQFTDMKKVIDNKEQLVANLSTLDLMAEDLEHLIEFNNFNVVDGYMICKMLHEVRVARREVKNQLENINFLKKSSLASLINGGFTKKLEGYSKKRYTPKTEALSQLFKVSHFKKEIVNAICEDIRRIA